jgi:hypothetical protein
MACQTFAAIRVIRESGYSAVVLDPVAFASGPVLATVYDLHELDDRRRVVCETSSDPPITMGGGSTGSRRPKVVGEPVAQWLDGLSDVPDFVGTLVDEHIDGRGLHDLRQ